MKTKSIEELKALLTSIAEPMNIEVVDVVFKMSKDPSLTVYIDTEDGVDLDTCEKYHNAIDAPLDEFDFTLGASYTLNVRVRDSTVRLRPRAISSGISARTWR